MTSTALKLYTAAIAIICAVAIAWSINQSAAASTWRTEVGRWQTVAHADGRARPAHRAPVPEARPPLQPAGAEHAALAAAPARQHEHGPVRPCGADQRRGRPDAGRHRLGPGHPHKLMTTGAYMTTAAWTWPATGTTWQIHHSGGVAQATAAAVAAAVAADERRWSRFLADSDVSRLNAAAGSRVEVSQETLDLLAACAAGCAAQTACSSRWSGARWRPGGTSGAWPDRPAAPASSPPRPAGARGSHDRPSAGAGRRYRQARARSRRDRQGMDGRPGGGPARRTLSDDPSVLVDAGGDLVAARGEHVVDVEAPFGAGRRRSPACGWRSVQGVATSGFDRRSGAQW